MVNSVTAPLRRAALLALVLLILFGAGWPVATAQEASPAALANRVSVGLAAGQRELLLGRLDAARTETEAAVAAAAELSARMTVDPTVQSEVTSAAEALLAALDANDQVAFGVARGALWTTILRGAARETIAAAQAGDGDRAAAWFLVREYRRTTKLSRPSTDGALAVRSLQAGEIEPAEAAAIIEADLLDTYQGLLDAALATATASARNAYRITQAEATADAQGYWAIIADAFETQRDAEQRAEADATFAGLVDAARSGDSAAFDQSIAAASTIVAGFRAAPMSESETANRAHQLLLYLGLVAVEYGRGVRGTEVSIDIEIIEAQAFLDAARAAFADLRPALAEIDPVMTEAIATDLATLDEQIRSAGRHEHVAPAGEIKDAVASLESRLDGLYPDAWAEVDGGADFEVIAAILDQMEAAVAAGQYQQAESARIQAYAIYETGPEKHLLGFAPNVALRAEALFWQGNSTTRGLAYAIQDHASLDEVRAIRAELDAALEEGQRRLGADRPSDGAIVFNAATIVFREGLEAVLILASLMASMIGLNARFKKPLGIGAVAALVVTAVLFVLAQTALSSLSQYGEKLEAIVSLVAIGVLLVVMNWFFHKVYWTKWIAHHHTRRRMIIGGAAGQMLGLVLLEFTSVFREGAETVLFLQALVLDAGTRVVIEGVALGLAATAVVGALVFIMQAKLPHKKMLIVTGLMIALVLVMMVGTTIHVWQIVGWMPIHPIGDLIFPYWTGTWLGLYATWEGVIAQSLAVIFVIGSYFLAEWQHDRSLQRRLEASEAAAMAAGSGAE